MKQKIIDLVNEMLSFFHCEVEDGYTSHTYRLVFDGMIHGSVLRILIDFCVSNNYFYYVNPSELVDKVEFVIYK